MLALVGLHIGPALELGGRAQRPVPVELGPPVEVVEGQRAEVDLVLLGVRPVEVLVPERRADLEHRRGVVADGGDGREQILDATGASEDHAQQRL